jgi:hypothetical protein
LYLTDQLTLKSNVITKQVADALGSITLRVKQWEVLFPDVIH